MAINEKDALSSLPMIVAKTGSKDLGNVLDGLVRGAIGGSGTGGNGNGDVGETTTLIYAFSTARRLVAGAAKPAEIYRADSGSSDLAFDSNGYSNTAGLASYLGSQAGYWGRLKNQTGGTDFFNESAAVAIANSPTINLYDFNSKPSMSFDGSRYLYDNSATATAPNNYTVSIVFKPESSAANQTLFRATGSSSAQELLIAYTGATGQIGYRQNNTWVYAGTKGVFGAQVLTVIFSAANGATILVNGQPVATGLAYTATPLYDAMRIGSGSIGGFVGLMTELQIWTGAMSLSGAQRVAADAMAFYGLNMPGALPQRASANSTDRVVARNALTGELNEVLVSGLPSSAGGVYSYDPVDPYGAVGNGSTNDSPAFVDMFADITTAGGGKVQLRDQAYALNSQVMLSTWNNTTIDGLGIGELTKTSANTLRMITAGTSGAPHSLTTPQIKNVKLQNLRVQGLGTIAGNNASLINSGGNIFQFLSAFNLQVNNCYFSDIDNGAIRLPTVSEGDLFFNLNLTPTIVSTNSFSVTGDQTATFPVGTGAANFFGVFNGSPTVIQNLVACGYVTSAIYDGVKTTVTLNVTRGSVAGTITNVGQIRTLYAFPGFVQITQTLFENVKQPITTNTTGTKNVMSLYNYFKNSGSVKPTSQIYENDYFSQIGGVFDNCAERVYLQGTRKCRVQGNLFFNGTGINGNSYGSVTIAPNDEEIVSEDKDTFIFQDQICEGDYQGFLLLGNTNQVYSEVIVRNSIFRNISAMRGSEGIVSVGGRIKRLVIEGNKFINCGSALDIIKIIPRCFSTDTFVEEIVIRNNEADGGRFWLYFDGDTVGNTRYPTDARVHNNQVKGCKGHFLRNVDRMVWEDNYLEYAASDGTPNQFYFQNITNSNFEKNTISVAAGSTVARTLFGVLSSASNTAFRRNKITMNPGAFVAQANGTVATTGAAQFTITDLRVQSGTVASTGAAQFTITETGTSYVSRYPSGTYFQATAAGATIATGTVSGTPTYEANVTTINVTVSTGALAGMDGAKYGTNHTANYSAGRPVQATQTGTVIGRANVSSSSYSAGVTTVNVSNLGGTLTSMDGASYQVLVNGIENGSTSVNFVVEDNDITATNTALSINGTNLTGSIKRNKLRGGGTSGLCDIFIGASVGALILEDNDYVTGNVSIDFTGVRNIKSFTWNPPNIGNNASSSTTVTVPNASFSDQIIIMPGISLQGMQQGGFVSTNGAFTNISGGVVAYATATTFTVTDAGVNHTAEFPQRRYVRFLVAGAYLGYGYVTTSSYNGTNTTTVTVNVVEGSMPSTLDDVDYWTDGVVTLTLNNHTGGALDIASSIWYAQTRKRI